MGGEREESQRERETEMGGRETGKGGEGERSQGGKVGKDTPGARTGHQRKKGGQDPRNEGVLADIHMCPSLPVY